MGGARTGSRSQAHWSGTSPPLNIVSYFIVVVDLGVELL